MTTRGLTPPMLVAGERRRSQDTFDVVNPATGELVGRAPECSPEDLDLAMRGAQTAFESWRHDDAARASALHAAADAIEAVAYDLAPVLTAEQGKPLHEAGDELATTVAWLRYYADIDFPHDVIRDDSRAQVEVLYEPLGVVAAITPWNFPVSLATWKLAPALRAGNTVVLKPSPYTPLTSLLVAEVLSQVLPAGVLNVVTGSDPLGALMTSHPIPRKVSFTGSTATGKRVMAACVPTLKRVTLELGGNDPAIVLPDASPEHVAPRLFWGAFLNNGQVCLAAKRVYVHESIHDELVAALVAEAEAAQVGNGAEPGVRLGPVNNRAQLDRVQELVAGALAQGAVAASGGRALDGPGLFHAPTILTDARDGMPVVDEEQFGPVLPVVRYAEVDDAVRAANGGDYGLTASVWSDDPDQASAVARQLDVGSVSVNRHAGAVGVDLPFAGRRWSGVGAENGPWGLHTYLETKAFARPGRKQVP